MQNADCRLRIAKRNGPHGKRFGGRCASFPSIHIRIPQSAIRNPHSRLIEMLVVIGIIGMLAAMLTAVIVSARHLSIRIECQQNLKHIGQTVSMLVLSNNGLYPIGPPRQQQSRRTDGLSNAYPKPQAADTNPRAAEQLRFPVVGAGLRTVGRRHGPALRQERQRNL